MNAAPRTTEPTTARADRAHVRELMHAGVISCPPDSSLAEVARLMCECRVHCVVVADEVGSGPPAGLWGVVSDLDLAAAAAVDAAGRTAGDWAATPVVTVSPDDSVRRAAQLMVEHATTHLVVLDPRRKHPVGVISTLDIARALAA